MLHYFCSSRGTGKELSVCVFYLSMGANTSKADDVNSSLLKFKPPMPIVEDDSLILSYVYHFLPIMLP